MNNYNELTPGQTERLAILVEEAGEVLQICGKILRHGYDSSNPNDKAMTTNSILLANEIGDLLHSIDLVAGNDIVEEAGHIYKSKVSRADRLKKYTHHQKDI